MRFNVACIFCRDEALCMGFFHFFAQDGEQVSCLFQLFSVIGLVFARGVPSLFFIRKCFGAKTVEQTGHVFLAEHDLTCQLACALPSITCEEWVAPRASDNCLVSESGMIDLRNGFGKHSFNFAATHCITHNVAIAQAFDRHCPPRCFNQGSSGKAFIHDDAREVLLEPADCILDRAGRAKHDDMARGLGPGACAEYRGGFAGHQEFFVVLLYQFGGRRKAQDALTADRVQLRGNCSNHERLARSRRRINQAWVHRLPQPCHSRIDGALLVWAKFHLSPQYSVGLPRHGSRSASGQSTLIALA